MLNTIAGLLGDGVPVSLTDFESIATATPSGTSSITFSSIPSTYSHLQIRASLVNASNGGTMRGRFNGVTSNLYGEHYLEGSGSTVTAGADSSQTYMYLAYITTGAVNSSSNAAAFIMDVLDYANTNKNKTVRVLAGSDNNTTNGTINFISSLFRDTTAISSLTLDMSGINFSAGTTFALYGIK